MKKAALILLGGILVAAAVAPRAHAAAVSIDLATCYMLAGDCKTFVVTSDATVTSRNQKGSWKLSCKAKLAEGVPLPAKGSVACDFSNTGLLCDTEFGSTVDWQEVVTSSGSASLICQSH